MNFKKVEGADIFRRFSTSFDDEFYLVKYDGEGDDSSYYLLKLIGKFMVSPSMWEENQSSKEKANSNE